MTSVTWANNRGGSGTAVGTTSWTAANIPLQAGANVITVTAQDTSGNTGDRYDHGDVATFTYYLAEGATGTFFDLDILDRQPECRRGAGHGDVPEGGRHDGDAALRRRRRRRG